MVREDISIFFNLLRLVLWHNIWFILENYPCVPNKNIYSAVVGQNVLYMPVRSIGSLVSFKSTVSLLIECFIHFLSGYEKPQLWLYYCLLLLLALLVFALSIYVSDVWYISIYNCFILMDWPFYYYRMIFLASFYHLYFVWSKYSYLSLFLSFSWNDFF